MKKEIEVYCLLGNGICPKTCTNYPIAREMTEKLGDKFDPFFARLAVVFGDSKFEGVHVGHVVKAMSRCVRGKPRERIEPV